MQSIDETSIARLVYIIRSQKVMLDSDLAKLYEVETAQLTRQVRRNMIRFPEDFMFQLTEQEFEVIRIHMSQNSGFHGGRRYMPLAFTEVGVSMLSSVLTSERAALVNISIMRMFIRLRSFLAMESTLSERVSALEKGTNQLFRVVFERLDSLEKTEPIEQPRKRIGLKNHGPKS